LSGLWFYLMDFLSREPKWQIVHTEIVAN